MTVHKSQGSEFDHVLLVLPQQDSPLLARELLYTAVTRARQRVTVVAEASLLETTISRRTHRASGLLDALGGGPIDAPTNTAEVPAVDPPVTEVVTEPADEPVEEPVEEPADEPASALTVEGKPRAPTQLSLFPED